jgi:hypothetical protein
MSADFKPREGVTFEWIDPPGTLHRRWRARMHRDVFVQLVRERLGIEHPAMERPQRPRRQKTNFKPATSNIKQETIAA